MRVVEGYGRELKGIELFRVQGLGFQEFGVWVLAGLGLLSGVDALSCNKHSKCNPVQLLVIAAAECSCGVECSSNCDAEYC